MESGSSSREIIVKSIIDAIGLTGTDAAVQRIQSRFRCQIVESWKIPSGASVLEIGCGQGDMTAVLAATVGPGGRVKAIDMADRDTGAPVTIGAATDRITASHLGGGIEFQLRCNLLDMPQLGCFDYVVFAHSAWYFRSQKQLVDTLAAAKHFAPVLCLSEWDIEPRSIEQLGHLLSLQILGIMALLNPDHSTNVRTPLSRRAIKTLIQEAGWTIDAEHALQDPALQDGDWELTNVLDIVSSEWQAIGRVSLPLQNFLTAQVELLRSWRTHHNRVQPLNSFSVRAIPSP